MSVDHPQGPGGVRDRQLGVRSEQGGSREPDLGGRSAVTQLIAVQVPCHLLDEPPERHRSFAREQRDRPPLRQRGRASARVVEQAHDRLRVRPDSARPRPGQPPEQGERHPNPQRLAPGRAGHRFPLTTGVEATLLRGAIFLPPPAPGALVLARSHRARARRAADAGISQVVESVVRDVVAVDIGPDLAPGPVGEGIDLDDAPMGLVDLHLSHPGACRCLLPAQPGDPGVEPGERALERLDLPDRAAALAGLNTAVEEVDASFAGHGLDGLGAGEEDLDVEIVALPDRLHDGVGLGHQPPRVEREDPDTICQLRHHVDQYDALGGEARAEAEAGLEGFQGPGEHLLGTRRFDVLRDHELFDVHADAGSKNRAACEIRRGESGLRSLIPLFSRLVGLHLHQWASGGAAHDRGGGPGPREIDFPGAEKPISPLRN